MSSTRGDKTVQLQVRNLKEVQRRLRAIGDDAVDDLKKAHAESARIVELEAKKTVPVKRVGSGDSSYIRRGATPGRLKASIRSTGQARAGVVRAGGESFGVLYAGVIHYGWPDRPNYGVWKGKIVWGGPIKAQPFMFEAMANKEDEVEEVFIRMVNEAIDRHLGG
ncbi:MAG TPA: HK97 gp10 family phage protein [Acidimicrobiia bacterium]